MKVGDKVKVPRTGGGYSDGEIVEIYQDRAYVKFPVGATYRGEPVKTKDKGRLAHKNVALADLIPIEEAALTLKCKICGKPPSEIEEYIEMAKIEGYATPDDFVIDQEGTLNKETGLFYCTDCYIKIGMPLGTA